jgi:hypothetical protein
LTKKAAEREQDRLFLCRDIEEVDQFRVALFARIGHHNSELLGRLQTFLIEIQRMAELETMLNCQMGRMGGEAIPTKEGGGRNFQMNNGEGMKGAANPLQRIRTEWAKRLREQ